MVKKKEGVCSTGDFCFCKAALSILIIVLVWISQETWSKIVITVAAAIILLSAGSCCRCGTSYKKKK